jgi:hypothetical protein|tara:strand:+ start:3858 stop:4580 length:723 start_codon:yes stop_codon:yes gene_type:complete
VKIAILGCSFSSIETYDDYTDSWAYQLYKKYPQHDYYNYALGGRSIDYSTWCLLDAKINDMDFVFINRTYYPRVGVMQDIEGVDDLNKFEFYQRKIDDNFYQKFLLGSELWRSGGGTRLTLTKTENSSPLSKVTSYPNKQERYATHWLDNMAISEHRQSYVDQLYNNMHKLYNFKYFKLLEFNRYHGSNNIWRKIRKEYGVETNFSISDTNDHWTRDGNTWVLENFILDKETVDILEKGK